MTTNSKILKELQSLAKEVQELREKISNTPPIDSAEADPEAADESEFPNIPERVRSYRVQFNAYKAAGGKYSYPIGRDKCCEDSCDAEHEHKFLMKLYKYQPTDDRTFEYQYWWEFQRYCVMGADFLQGYAKLDVETFKDIQQVGFINRRVNEALRYAKGFNAAAVFHDAETNKGKSLYIKDYVEDAKVVQAYELDRQMFGSVVKINKQGIPQVNYKSYNREDCAIINFDFSALPDFILMRPYLGKGIYFKNKLDMIASQINMVCLVKGLDNRKKEQIIDDLESCYTSHITVFEKASAKKKVSLADVKEQQGNQFTNAVEFFGPDGTMLTATYDVCKANVDRCFQEMLNGSGFPCGDMTTAQDLVSDVDKNKNGSNAVLMHLIENVSEFQSELYLLANRYLEKNGEELEEKKMEENQIGETVTPTNQNAGKNDGDTKTDGEEIKEELK